jgi:hypothetical protein
MQHKQTKCPRHLPFHKFGNKNRTARSKLFPHVNVDQIWDSSTTTQNNIQYEKHEQSVNSSAPTDVWSYLGPSQDTAINITQLPPLLPGKMYSQVKVQ